MARLEQGRSEEMQRNAVVFLAVAIVTVGMFAGLDVGAKANLSASSGSSCSNPISLRTYSVQSSESILTTVLLMAPGSTALVCIAYTFEGAGSFVPTSGALICGPYRVANGSIGRGCSGEVAIATSTPPFDHLSGASITIAYAVRSSENAEGVFWFWVDCGEFFPIAVGTAPSSLTFPIISGCVYEPNALGAGVVVGASNLGVSAIRVG
jgi:hypothetical protein